MSKFDLRIRAEKLRKQGKSLGQIRSELGISKSTLSLWCRDIVLSPSQKRLISDRQIASGHAGRIKGAQVNRQKRLDAETAALAWAKSKLSMRLTKREMTLIAAALYWAEGSKSIRTSGFIFVNSDPHMVELVLTWLTKYLNIPQNDIQLTVVINESHRHRENKILNFWVDLLSLSKSNFDEVYYLKGLSKKIYSNADNYYGVIRLKVKRSSFLKYKVIALISVLKSMSR